MVFDKKNKIIKITWRNAKRKKCAWFVKMHSTAYVRGKKNALTVKKKPQGQRQKMLLFSEENRREQVKSRRKNIEIGIKKDNRRKQRFNKKGK